MAQVTEVGSFTTNTTTGSQTITLNKSDWGASDPPKAVILWGNNRTAAGEASEDIQFGIGCATSSTDEGSCAINCEDGQNNSDTKQSCEDDSVLHFVEANGSVSFRADFTSFGNNSFTINISTNSNSRAIIVNYCVIGGSTVTNAKLHQWQLPSSSTSSHSITGVGFQPDIHIGFNIYEGTTGIGNDGNLNIAVADGAGGSNCGNTSYYSNDNSGSVEANTYHYTWYVAHAKRSHSGTAANYGYITAYTSDGATVNVSKTDTVQSKCYTLFLKGGSYEFGTATPPTTTPTGTLTTTTGLTNVNAVLTIGCRDGDLATNIGDGCITFGGSDGTRHRCAGFFDENGLTVTDVRQTLSTTNGLQIYDSSTPGISDEATAAFDGADIDWTFGTSSSNNARFHWLAFDGPSAATSVTVNGATETDTAQAVGIKKGVNAVTETDTAQAVTALKAKFIAVGAVTETDTASLVGIAKGVGSVTETDTAQAVVVVKPIVEPVVGATETDTASLVGVAKGILPATETDSAQTVAALQSKVVAVGVATETDTANLVGLAKGVLPATETDTAQAVIALKPIFVVVGSATETDTAQAIGRKLGIGLATETDTASLVGIAKGILPATETDTAQVVTPQTAGETVVPVTAATESDTAALVGIKKGVGDVTETDTAQIVSVLQAKVIAVGVVTETDTAALVGVAKGVLPATETDTAQAVTAQVAGETKVTVTAATENDTAALVGIAKGVLPATETDSAQAVTPLRTRLVSVTGSTENDSAQVVTPLLAKSVAIILAQETDSAAEMRAKLYPTKVTGAIETDTAQTVAVTGGAPEVEETIIVLPALAEEAVTEWLVAPKKHPTIYLGS